MDDAALATTLNAVWAELTKIRDRLDRLVALEAEHVSTRRDVDRAFTEIRAVKVEVDGHDERIKVLELDRPVQELIKKWVLSLLGLILLGAAVSAILLVFPKMKIPLL